MFLNKSYLWILELSIIKILWIILSLYRIHRCLACKFQNLLRLSSTIKPKEQPIQKPKNLIIFRLNKNIDQNKRLEFEQEIRKNCKAWSKLSLDHFQRHCINNLRSILRQYLRYQSQLQLPSYSKTIENQRKGDTNDSLLCTKFHNS